LHDSKTDIQQFPLEPATQPERDGAQTPHSGQVYCLICGSLVSLENCKLNEHGDPVHDHCYFHSVSSPVIPDETKPKSEV